jgi:hypothetical protein
MLKRMKTYFNPTKPQQTKHQSITKVVFSKSKITIISDSKKQETTYYFIFLFIFILKTKVTLEQVHNCYSPWTTFF